MNGFLNTILKQVVSKDVLYEPMKEMYEKYPGWLEQNQGKIDPKEFDRYVSQYGYVEEIIHTFESEGETSFDKVMKLMTEMQDCGQPPMDIVQEMAPGVAFGADGLPQLDPNLLKPGEGCTIQ
eukprot:TRINITY_DN536_c0_g1_i1.p1 TRINITY_DN536_c0_g1~~TRINITY_DN536_c0_g1_i1.p1  ORF type:complete len:123 (-),score=34.59 TRINITY_DN536_c0_g1_i1:210-578(-)